MNVTATQVNGSRVSVSWAPPLESNGHIEGYTIFHRPQSINVGPAQSVRVSASESFCVIESEFHGNTTYEFWVKARNRKLESLSSKLVQLKFDGTSNIDAITGVRIVTQNQNSVTLTWQTIKIAEGYIIQPILPQPYPRIEPIRVKAPPATISNLVSGAQYVFKVSAFVKKFIGHSQNIFTTIPGPPLPEVSNLLVVHNKDQIMVKWDKPNTTFPYLTYGVYYGTTSNELFDFPKIRTNDTVAIIKNVVLCESYLISVGIIGPNGPGPLGRNPKMVETEYNEKKSPNYIDVDIDNNSHEMKLKWEHSCPLTANSKYPGYIVSL